MVVPELYEYELDGTAVNATLRLDEPDRRKMKLMEQPFCTRARGDNFLHEKSFVRFIFVETLLVRE